MEEYDTLFITEADKDNLINKMSDMGYIYGEDYTIEEVITPN